LLCSLARNGALLNGKRASRSRALSTSGAIARQRFESTSGVKRISSVTHTAK
jgi:hypothetical protein